MRIGRYGPFLQRGEGGEGNTASLPDDLPPADLTVEHAVQLLEAKAQGPRDLGIDPATGLHVYVIVGRFGAYVQLGETEKGSKEKPRARVADRRHEREDDHARRGAQAAGAAARAGDAPSDGQVVIAGQGRFGPYVKHGDEFRSLEDNDDVFTIDLDARVELLAAPKKSRGRKSAARTVLKEVGPHPRERRDDQPAGRPLRSLRHRRHDQRVGAQEPPPEQVTLEQAVELLAAREGAPKKARAARRAALARGRRRGSGGGGVVRQGAKCTSATCDATSSSG